MTLGSKTLDASERVFDPQHGYDMVAPFYENWRWFKFWRLNERPLVRRWLASLPRGGLGLDAGTGTGPYLIDIISLGQRCVAIDFSQRMLDINRENHQRSDGGKTAALTYVRADIAALPFGDGQFDWLFSSRVLSHAPHLKAVLSEFARVLKRGGECLITDVHPEHPYTRVAIPTDEGKIGIETHKHSLRELRSSISETTSLQLVNLDEYHLADLRSAPSPTDFEKLYCHPNPAIFYACRLKKR